MILAASAAPAHAVSGAPAIVCGPPVTTVPDEEVRVSAVLSNQGTTAPGSMTVNVTITPVTGDLDATRAPVSNSADFVYTGGLIGATGPQTLTFTKADPQIPAGGNSTLRFSFFRATSGDLNRGTITVAPQPDTGTGTPNTGDYP